MTATRSSSHVIFRTTLLWSGIYTVVLAVVMGVIGFLVDGVEGLWGALLGVLLSAVFLGLTAVIMLIAGRLEGPENFTAYFGTIIVGWVVKLIVFIVALVLLRGQPWLNGMIFFIAVLASVIGSLVIDMVAFARARVPYVGDVALPTSSQDPEDRPSGT